MDDTLIVAIFTVIDDVMTTLGHPTHSLAGASESDAAHGVPVTVAVVAACRLQNHPQRALCVLHGMHSLSGSLSLSRFMRGAASYGYCAAK